MYRVGEHKRCTSRVLVVVLELEAWYENRISSSVVTRFFQTRARNDGIMPVF